LQHAAHAQEATGAESAAAQPTNPLPGYQVVEITVPDDSPTVGSKLSDITWPAGYLPVSLLRNRHLRPPEPHLVMRPGDRIALLAQVPS
jgi:Trk K+ transport system NAD-binding subunit